MASKGAFVGQISVQERDSCEGEKLGKPSLPTSETQLYVSMASAMVEDSGFEDDQLASLSIDDIARASRLLDNEIRILKVRSLCNQKLSFHPSVIQWVFITLVFFLFEIEGRVAENESGVRVVQRENKGKSREDQAQQAVTLPCWEHRWGKFVL